VVNKKKNKKKRKEKKTKPRLRASSRASSRKLVAIMFTDMVGYTAMAQKNEALAFRVLEEQRKLLRPIFHENRGREIDTKGDAFLVEFNSALNAVECSLKIQRILKETNARRADDRKILLRIGIHLGDVIHKGKYVGGDAVNVASRIEPLAEPGGVCLTEEVYHAVLNKVGCDFESIGNPHLKNVSTPIEVYRVSGLQEGLSRQTIHATAGLAKNRIAVLPFSSLSPDPNDEYFADGLTEEMIARLSLISGLDVIARTSIMNYKGKTGKNAINIGKDLSAGTLLEGSVRKAANKVRVTAQLIDSTTEGHLWAETYDRELEDIFEVQADISERVASSLAVRLLPREREGIKKGPTENMEAYELYLKGRKIWFEFNQAAWNRAISYFKHAIEIDPSFALAHTGLADCYSLLAIGGYANPREAITLAKTSAEKALKLDEHLAEAHLALGACHYLSYEWKEGETELARALELEPSNALAHAWHGIFIGWLGGRLDDAITEFRKAVDLDPLSPLMNYYLAKTLYYGRRYDESIERYKISLHLDPSDLSYHWWIAFVYIKKSMFIKALEEIQTVATTLAYGDPRGLSFLAIAYALLDKRDEAGNILQKLETLSKERYVAPDLLGSVYLVLGDREKGFELFSRAVYERCTTWIDGLKFDPILDPVREDPRFTSLLNKVGLAPFLKDAPTVEMRTFDKKRIAILPFANISLDPNDEYFADGMTEELISRMSKISDLKVIARTSVMAFKGEKKKITDIAKELQVGTIVEGSVRKAGNKIRITAQLIDTRSGDHLWADSFDDEIEDVFQIQSEIASKIANLLQIQLLPNEVDRIQNQPTRDSEAYLYYLKGVHYYFAEYTEAGMRNAIEYFEKCIGIDSIFASAYAMMSDAYDSLSSLVFERTRDLADRKSLLAKSEDLAEKAVKLDPKNAEVRYALSNVKMRKLDIDGMEYEIREALRLNPNLSAAHQTYGWLLLTKSKVNSALKELEKALETDPLSAPARLTYVMALVYGRMYERAEAEARKALNFHVGESIIHYMIGVIYYSQSRYEEALAEFVLDYDPSHPFEGPLAVAYAKLGRKDITHRILSKMIEKDNKLGGEKIPIMILYVSLDDKEKALEYFDKATPEELSGFLPTLANDPIFDPVRTDPRYIATMKKVGLSTL
jgi:adenylate cyclase